MTEKDTKNTKKNYSQKENTREFALEDFKLKPISSSEYIATEKENLNISVSSEVENDALSVLSSDDEPFKNLDSTDEELVSLESENPIFRELYEPKLPALAKENRARLQMQSPTRLNFYWTFKNNPFQTLNRVFSKQAGNYTLVVKLVNQTVNTEEIVPIETSGSSWFDAEADSSYQAEIGFYAANRPFVRVMLSNIVETPRKNPSPRRAASFDWSVSANQFAQVLDVSGYAHDSVEVVLVGDDAEFADDATRSAFSQFIGTPEESDFSRRYQTEIRFVLLALASGYELENLREQISKNLFAKLRQNTEKLSAENALAALQENFGGFADEITEEQFFAPTVFGASLINFPRFSKRRILPKFAPISSLRS